MRREDGARTISLLQFGSGECDLFTDAVRRTKQRGRFERLNTDAGGKQVIAVGRE